MYEYIRGYSFKLLERNIENLMAVSTQEHISFAFTSCNLNILNLEEFCSWFSKLRQKHPSKTLTLELGQIVLSPEFLSPWLLPSSKKDEALKSFQRILEKNYPFVNSSEMNALSSSLKDSKDDEYFKFKSDILKYTRLFNTQRNVQFQDIDKSWDNELTHSKKVL